MPRALRNCRARAVATAPVRCAIYTRKSTDAGLDQSFNSLDNQREAAEAYITSQRHEGWTALPDRFDDGGFSGGNTDRPALHGLLTEVEAGRVDVIVVYKLDRLSRSLFDFLNLHRLLEKHGVQIVSVTEPIDTRTPMGRAFVNVLISFGQMEREVAGERTAHKIRATRRKGKWTGGTPPLGYDTTPEGGRLVVNRDEAGQVRTIFSMYIEKPSLTAVADELNRRGWTTKSWMAKTGMRRGGGPWTKVTLRRLLTDPLNIGLQKLGNETFRGEHDAIVPKGLFDQVQRLLEGNRSNGGSAHRNRHGALLRGLLRCAACDAPMTFAPTKKGGRVYRYYRCSAAMKHGRSACATGSLPANKIETLVIDQIRRVGADPALQAETFRQVLAEAAAKRRGLKAEAKRLTRQIATAEKTVTKLVHTLADARGDARGAINTELEKGQEQLRSLEARLVELRAQEADLAAQDIDEADVARALEEFDAIWEVLLTPERERVLQLLIERVSYTRETEELRITLSPAGISTLQGELDGVATP